MFRIRAGFCAETSAQRAYLHWCDGGVLERFPEVESGKTYEIDEERGRRREDRTKEDGVSREVKRRVEVSGVTCSFH